MKRSEVLELIDEVLYSHRLPLLHGGISKEILGKLEKAGMLPPQYLKNIKMNIYGSEVESVKPVSEWEPEEPERSGAW